MISPLSTTSTSGSVLLSGHDTGPCIFGRKIDSECICERFERCLWVRCVRQNISDAMPMFDSLYQTRKHVLASQDC